MNSKLCRFSMVISILLATIFHGMAQESTLWLRNGKKVTITNYMTDTADYYEGKISYTTVKGKYKTKYKEDVFSVMDDQGNETIFYTPNFEFGELLTPMQMKAYVTGIGDANSAHLSPLVSIGGLLSGVTGAIIPQPEISLGAGSMPLPVGFLVPVAYVSFMGAMSPGENELKARYPVKSSELNYLMGYQDGIRKKRIKQSLWGSAIGFFATAIVITVVN